MELKVYIDTSTSLHVSLDIWIHSMELKAYLDHVFMPSVNVSDGIHSMELKVVPLCFYAS